jgi:hypothetical protein
MTPVDVIRFGESPIVTDVNDSSASMIEQELFNTSFYEDLSWLFDIPGENNGKCSITSKAV